MGFRAMYCVMNSPRWSNDTGPVLLGAACLDG